MRIMHHTDPDGVEAAKRRFIHLATEIDPLTPVRKYPLIAVGTAAALGAVAATPAVEKSLVFTKAIDRLMMTTVPLVNQVIKGALQAIAMRHQSAQPTNQSGETT